MNTTAFNAESYEKRYQQGYGLVYPESHIIRVHKHILEWELKLSGGKIFDFGCGSGSHLKYFADHGFVPYGCDTSASAIERCKKLMSDHASHFAVTPVNPDLPATFGKVTFDIFLSNQVLYFLDNAGIREIVRQAHSLVRRGGVFISTMMSYSCWYSRYVTGVSGDFKKVNLDTPRQQGELLINFKQRDELPALFEPFKALHLGSYGSHVRQEEGSTDHWLYVGIRE
jgi:SAM-dependent methyltransferase